MSNYVDFSGKQSFSAGLLYHLEGARDRYVVNGDHPCLLKGLFNGSVTLVAALLAPLILVEGIVRTFFRLIAYIAMKASPKCCEWPTKLYNNFFNRSIKATGQGLLMAVCGLFLSWRCKAVLIKQGAAEVPRGIPPRAVVTIPTATTTAPPTAPQMPLMVHIAPPAPQSYVSPQEVEFRPISAEQLPVLLAPTTQFRGESRGFVVPTPAAASVNTQQTPSQTVMSMQLQEELTALAVSQLVDVPVAAEQAPALVTPLTQLPDERSPSSTAVGPQPTWMHRARSFSGPLVGLGTGGPGIHRANSLGSMLFGDPELSDIGSDKDPDEVVEDNNEMFPTRVDGVRSGPVAVMPSDSPDIVLSDMPSTTHSPVSVVTGESVAAPVKRREPIPQSDSPVPPPLYDGKKAQAANIGEESSDPVPPMPIALAPTPLSVDHTVNNPVAGDVSAEEPKRIMTPQEIKGASQEQLKRQILQLRDLDRESDPYPLVKEMVLCAVRDGLDVKEVMRTVVSEMGEASSYFRQVVIAIQSSVEGEALTDEQMDAIFQEECVWGFVDAYKNLPEMNEKEGIHHLRNVVLQEMQQALMNERDPKVRQLMVFRLRNQIYSKMCDNTKDLLTTLEWITRPNQAEVMDCEELLHDGIILRNSLTKLVAKGMPEYSVLALLGGEDKKKNFENGRYGDFTTGVFASHKGKKAEQLIRAILKKCGQQEQEDTEVVEAMKAIMGVLCKERDEKKQKAIASFLATSLVEYYPNVPDVPLEWLV